MKSILFDFGGTLDADGTTWRERFYPIYKEAGVGAPREVFNRAFHASDDALAERFPLKGAGLERTLTLQVRCVLEVLAPGRPELSVAIAGRFLKDCRTVFRRNRPVLERLARTHRLGIVSNFYGNLESVLESEGLRELFSAVADSEAIGTLKPQAGIFRHALATLGAAAQDCVMVGDSIARDMRGAEALGMPHALLTQDPSASCCPKAWTLSALPQLENRIGAASLRAS